MKRMKFSGMADQAAQFLQREQLMDAALWKKFVDVFHTRPDGENHGWRGEYWGKMMRGAVLVYEYTRDEQLYKVLEDRFPKSLSCDWDNDGLMCASSLECEVKKVLTALDVTEEVLEYAAKNGFDTVISSPP